MKRINVYTAYDNNKTVIGTIQGGRTTITKRKYNALINARTIGGTAGIYTDAEYDITVIDKNGDIVTFIR